MLCPVVRPCAVPCHQTLCPTLPSSPVFCIALRSRVPCPLSGAVPCPVIRPCGVSRPQVPCRFPSSCPVPLPVLRTCALFCLHALSLALPSGPIPWPCFTGDSSTLLLHVSNWVSMETSTGPLLKHYHKYDVSSRNLIAASVKHRPRLVIPSGPEGMTRRGRCFGPCAIPVSYVLLYL